LAPRPQRAKQAGDFLLVGVHTDEDVTERRGRHLPIMNLHERALSVLSCRWVDEVVIGGCKGRVLDVLL
jgi:ethanolamine-phosphate cytidylyltransferase